MESAIVTTSKVAEYERCKAVVKAGLQEFWRVGDALTRIRDDQLFQCGGYRTFEDCCREEFGIGRFYGYRLINGANVWKSLLTSVNTMPTQENQVRPLVRLAPPERVTIWQGLTDRLQLHEITGRVVQNAVRLFKQNHEHQQNVIVSPAIDLPPEGYRIIYADPPWQYGNVMPEYFDEQADHYQLLSLTEICEYEVESLPVRNIVQPNAVLFMWCTSPILEESFSVVNAWGFKYKASFVWDKVRHNMGHYNSVRHEFLLICVRGSCQPDVPKLFDSVVSVERSEHSRKPEIFREMIDALYPSGNRIELFARTQVEGWDTYGNELIS